MPPPLNVLMVVFVALCLMGGVIAAPAAAGPASPAAERCVVLGRTGGAVVLANRCGVCRAVALERRDRGGKWSRSGYMVAPASMIAVPTSGASGLRLADERNCHRR